MRAVRLTLYLAAPVLFVLLHAPFLETGHSICLFKNIFGFECPGCGMTRAFSALVHGDILSALGYNRSVVIVFPLLCFILAKGIAGELKGCALLDVSRCLRRRRTRV